MAAANWQVSLTHTTFTLDTGVSLHELGSHLARGTLVTRQLLPQCQRTHAGDDYVEHQCGSEGSYSDGVGTFHAWCS
jgi:hypothetical protein